MNVVGRVSSFITQGMYSVATPFHPFGGAVDIIVVKQPDGTFRTTPWYVRFGKFQGVLKGAEKIVRIEVNGVEANFHMCLDNSGEAYFVREVDPDKDDNEGLKDSEILKGIREDSSSDYSNINNGLEENDLYGEEANDFLNGKVDNLAMGRLERVDSIYYEFEDEQSSLEGSLEFSEYGSSRYDTLDSVEHALELHDSNSEVVLVSVDGHILTAPISSSEMNGENVQLNTPRFHLGPARGTEEYNKGEASWTSDYLSDLDASALNIGTENDKGDEEHLCHTQETQDSTDNDKGPCIDSSPERSTCLNRDEVFQSCLELSELSMQSKDGDQETVGSIVKTHETTKNPHEESPQSPLRNYETEKGNHEVLRIEDGSFAHDSEYPISVPLPQLQVVAATCERNNPNMDSDSSDRISVQFVSNYQELQEQMDVELSVKNKPIGLECPASQYEYSKIDQVEPSKGAPIEDMKSDISTMELETPEVKEDDAGMTSTPSRRWRLWAIPFRRVKTLEHTGSNSSNEEVFVDSESLSQSQHIVTTSTANAATASPRKQIIRTNVPTTDQIASLNLKEGQNMVHFIFSTRVLGSQKVEAHIYLWKWNTRIVISDVDGTITKSDVLGQFMPLVGRDWTHSGIAGLFSAIKENGYQLLFLSARAIVQAYLTKSFLFNLKQDGKSLPNGPVVISPDGLFPSLYREVIRRAPHEFKIACLEDIKALFPPDYNPFYAGFGNRDTDELSYRRIGIPKGKIFIINPKGEVAVNHRIDVKSYTSLHTLVHDMFPPTSLLEQEDFNSWNYWKTPLPELDGL